MNILKIFILLSIVGNVFSGGESKCGVLRNDFMGLLQIFEAIIQGVVNLVNNTVNFWPYIGASNIENYECTAEAATYDFAKGISELTDVDFDYVFGVFNGTYSPPFLEPLDCINDELLSYYLLIQNVATDLKPQWENLTQKSPINPDTPCTEVLKIVTPYYQRNIQVAVEGANIGIRRAALFANIGQTTLFLDYFKRIRICGANATNNILAELLNIDVSIVADFLANQSISVPPPLSCVKSLYSSYSDAIYSTYNTINNTINNTSPPLNCEPFYSQFVLFEGFWYKYVNELRNYAINQSVASPELAPFFISNLVCELDAMVMFAANATSYLSGADSDIIYNIIKGSQTSFVAPLDCIGSKLLFMSNTISTLVNSIIPGLESVVTNSSSDTSTCNTTYQALTPYVGKLVTLLNKKGIIMTNATIDFKSINIDELFLEAFSSVLDCLPSLVGKYIGAALNDNSTSVTSYVNGNRLSLPYPFTCVKIIINIMDSILNQAFVNFVTESASNVVAAPNIPKYRG